MMFVTRRRPSLVHVGLIATSAVLSGCGGESGTVRIHAEIESGDVFTVGVFTADGAGFCPTGIALPSRVEGVVGSGVAGSLKPGLGDYNETSGSGEVTVEIDRGFYVFDGVFSID